MKKIKVSKDKYVMVDDEDFDWLNQWRWGFDGRYARRRENGIKIYMHKIINKTPRGKMTDHINRNKLDNRRKNLRSVISIENIRNSKLKITNCSGYKGIWFWKQRNKWEVSITVNYKKIHLGLFDEIRDAINARKKGEELYW